MEKQQKAKYLFNTLKKKKLTLKEIKDKFPLDDVLFLKEFTEIIKNENDKNSEIDKNTLLFFNRQIELLIEIIKDGKITEKEKEQIISIIQDINDKIHEEKKQKEDNSHKFKKFVVGCGTALCAALAFIIVIFSGERKSPTK